MGVELNLCSSCGNQLQSNSKDFSALDEGRLPGTDHSCLFSACCFLLDSESSTASGPDGDLIFFESIYWYGWSLTGEQGLKAP